MMPPDPIPPGARFALVLGLCAALAAAYSLRNDPVLGVGSRGREK